MTQPLNHWFGKLHTRWPVVPLRSVAKLGTGHTPSRAVPEYWENCTIPWVTVEDIRRIGEWSLSPLLDTEQKISEIGLANSAAVLHPAGTVMLSRTASIGLSCIVGRPMATTQAFVTWNPEPSRIVGGYLLAALKAMGQQYEFLAYGATHLTIYFPDVKTLKIPLPPIQVQSAIADFLDRETAKIDALIADQGRLIALLQEKRQAVISHAVTKGIDPNASLRASGVEWIGEMPAHWDAAPVARVLREFPRYGVLVPDTAVDGVPMLRIVDIEDGKASRESLTIISAGLSGQYPRTILQAGDVVLSVVGTIGEAMVIDGGLVGANISRALARLVPGPTVEPAFLAMYLSSKTFEHFTDVVCAGSAQRVLNMDDLRSHRLPVPPVDEQRQIVSEIKRSVGQLDELVARARELAFLLNERRSALITAAVTGQIDVRGLVDHAA